MEIGIAPLNRNANVNITARARPIQLVDDMVISAADRYDLRVATGPKLFISQQIAEVLCRFTRSSGGLPVTLHRFDRLASSYCSTPWNEQRIATGCEPLPIAQSEEIEQMTNLVQNRHARTDCVRRNRNALRSASIIIPLLPGRQKLAPNDDGRQGSVQMNPVDRSNRPRNINVPRRKVQGTGHGS